MSGVEIIGVVAAAAQFIDLGSSVVFGLSRFISTFRDISPRIASTLASLQTFIELCRALKVRFEALPKRTISADFQIQIQGLFDACTADAVKLSLLLDEVVLKSSDGKLERSWKADVGVKRENDIVERCQRLERHKSTIILLLQDQTLELGLQELSLAADIRNEVRSNTQGIQSLTNMLQPAVTSVATDLAQLQITADSTQSEVRHIADALLCLQSKFDSDIGKVLTNTVNTQLMLSGIKHRCLPIPSGLTSIKAQHISTRVASESVPAAVKAAENTTEHTHLQLRDSLFRSPTMISSSDRDALREDIRLGTALARKPSLLREQLDSLEALGLNKSNFETGGLFRSVKPCGCPTKIRRRKNSTNGPFWALVDVQYAHVPPCQYKPQSNWTVTGGVFFVVARFQFALKLSLSATKGAGAFSLSPNLAVTRFVDRQVSPAFRLFDDVVGDFSERRYSSSWTHDRYRYWDGPCTSQYFTLRWDFIGLARNLRSITAQLETMFESSDAHPCDTDVEGRTLLHVGLLILPVRKPLADFKTTLQEVAVLSSLIQFPTPHVSAAFEGLIEFLILSGANRTARCRRLKFPILRFERWADFKEVDAMDIAMRGVLRYEDYYSPYDDLPNVVRCHAMLSKYGCEMTDTDLGEQFGENVYRMNPYIIAAVLKPIDDSAQVVGYGPVAAAVVARSLTELQRLLKLGHNPDEEGFGTTVAKQWRRPPLSLALGWPAGFEILLKAGANPVDAVVAATYTGDVEALTLLIDHDCPMSATTSCGRIVLDLFKIEELRIDQALIDKAISLAADQRARLWALARQSLSPVELKKLDACLNEGEVLDSGSVRVVQALLDRNIEVPLALRISTEKAVTIYNFSDYMTPEFAQKLFDAGFREFDMYHVPRDSDFGYGPTPFLRCCRMRQYDTAIWFLNMGARVQVDDSGRTWIARNVLASRLSATIDGDPLHEQGLNFLSILAKIQEPLKSDNCTCHCTVGGCTEITALHKRLSNDTEWRSTWTRKIYTVRCWLERGHFTPAAAKIAWKSFCRLEIFTRLGMAHTCCKYGHFWKAVYTPNSQEQAELREEDSKAGLTGQLASFMSEYEGWEQNSNDTMDAFLASWWTHMDSTLNFNDTRDGFLETDTGPWCCPREYFNCKADVFLMPLDELRDLVKLEREHDGPSSEDKSEADDSEGSHTV